MFNDLARSVSGAFSGLSRSMWLLALAQFINRSGSMVIFFLAVYLKDELMLDFVQVGTVMACYGAGALVGVYAGGRLTDRWGHYPVMIACLFGGCVFFVVASMTTGFVPLCIVLFLLSACGDGFRPAGMVAISHYSTPENYTRSVSLYRLAINLGFSIGPAIGGFLAAVNYQWLFWTDGATCLLAAAFVYFYLRADTRGSIVESKEDEPGDTIPERSPWRDKAYWVFLPMVTIYAIAFFQLFSTMSIYYKEHEGFNESQIGALLALNGLLVAAVEIILIYKIQRKGRLHHWIILGALLLTLSYVLILFLHGFLAFLFIIVLVSFSEMLVMPFTNTFMNNRSGKANRGQYASLYVMSWSASHIFTPLLATSVMNHWGYEPLWWLMIVFTLIVVLAMMLVERWSRLQ
jgi:predicted MFS family arabinose efflux permease